MANERAWALARYFTVGVLKYKMEVFKHKGKLSYVGSD